MDNLLTKILGKKVVIGDVYTLFDKAIIFCEDRNEELYDKIQKNEKIKKKINKEMHVVDIMNNNEQ